MGACTDFRTYTDLTREEAEKKFRLAQDESAYEDGNSYSGCIGVMPRGINWANETFPSAAEAQEHITKHHEKWEPAMGAAYVQVGYGKLKPKEARGFIIGGWCSS